MKRFRAIPGRGVVASTNSNRTYVRAGKAIFATEALSSEGNQLLEDFGVTSFERLGRELGDMKFDYEELESVLDDADWDYKSAAVKDWTKAVANDWLSFHDWPDSDTSDDMHKDRVKIWQIFYDDVQEFAQDRTAEW